MNQHITELPMNEDMDSFHEMLDRDSCREEEYEQHLIDYEDARYDALYDAEWTIQQWEAHRESQ